MGAEQDRIRQRILLFLATGLISAIITTSCGTVARPPKDEHGAWQDQMESQLLDRAEDLLKNEEYSVAVNVIGRAASCCRGRYSQRTLRLLESALAAPDNPIGSHSLAISCLKGLKNSFSGPVTQETARCRTAALNEILQNENKMLELKRKVRRLERQIEQLKAVDLERPLPRSGGDTHE
jgi:hypothetical protein